MDLFITNPFSHPSNPFLPIGVARCSPLCRDHFNPNH